jgi:hypothetical protein
MANVTDGHVGTHNTSFRRFKDFGAKDSIYFG